MRTREKVNSEVRECVTWTGNARSRGPARMHTLLPVLLFPSLFLRSPGQSNHQQQADLTSRNITLLCTPSCSCARVGSISGPHDASARLQPARPTRQRVPMAGSNLTSTRQPHTPPSTTYSPQHIAHTNAFQLSPAACGLQALGGGGPSRCGPLRFLLL